MLQINVATMVPKFTKSQTIAVGPFAHCIDVTNTAFNNRLYNMLFCNRLLMSPKLRNNSIFKETILKLFDVYICKKIGKTSFEIGLLSN